MRSDLRDLRALRERIRQAEAGGHRDAPAPLGSISLQLYYTYR